MWTSIGIIGGGLGGYALAASNSLAYKTPAGIVMTIGGLVVFGIATCVGGWIGSKVK